MNTLPKINYHGLPFYVDERTGHLIKATGKEEFISFDELPVSELADILLLLNDGRDD